MNAVNSSVLIMTMVFSNTGFGVNDDFVGSWRHVSGDMILQRFIVDEEMNVRGFRKSDPESLHTEEYSFKLTSYGHSLTSRNNNKKARKTFRNVTQTEIVELDENRIIVREYRKADPSVGGDSILLEGVYMKMKGASKAA